MNKPVAKVWKMNDAIAIFPVESLGSDANILAAAPALLEAAEAALECLQENGFGKAYVEDVLKAAIAKAKVE